MILGLFERVLAPILLMATVPSITVCMVYLVVNYGSDMSVVTQKNLLGFVQEAWMAVGIGDINTWLAVLGMALWAAISMTLLGGQRFLGPRTRNGFYPEYRHNAFRYYLLTLILAAVAFQWNLVDGYYWYKKLVPLTGTLMVFFSVVSFYLYVKGHVAPSKGEHGSSGNPIFDYYWGLELYPRLGRWLDFKLYCVSRFGIMAWLILVLVTWKAQYEYRGFSYAMTSSSIIQIIYIGKFFWWEDGYTRTIDIIVDRAGWYLCFGGGGFMPEFFIITNAYQVENDTHLTFNEFLMITGFGLVTIFLTYWVDYQRLIARETNGKCTIWGKSAKIVKAKYLDDRGEQKTNVLLASGFWGWTHHPNYIVELLADISMVLPVKTSSILPYSYVIFLVVLIIHRSFRDERKCREKYGKYWEQYCKISKYRLIPFLF